MDKLINRNVQLANLQIVIPCRNIYYTNGLLHNEGKDMQKEIRIPYPLDYKGFPIHAIDQTLVERFEDIVDLYPDQIAITFRGQKITYTELNERANRLARDIRNRQTNSPYIGFIAGQDPESIVSIWAIQKTGKTYLALNPAFPPSRVLDQINKLDIKLVLSGSRYFELAEEIQKSTINWY